MFAIGASVAGAFDDDDGDCERAVKGWVEDGVRVGFKLGAFDDTNNDGCGLSGWSLSEICAKTTFNGAPVTKSVGKAEVKSVPSLVSVSVFDGAKDGSRVWFTAGREALLLDG